MLNNINTIEGLHINYGYSRIQTKIDSKETNLSWLVQGRGTGGLTPPLALIGRMVPNRARGQAHDTPPL